MGGRQRFRKQFQHPETRGDDRGPGREEWFVPQTKLIAVGFALADGP
jgi:hypothetical protein